VDRPTDIDSKIAYIFPGQGSQFVGMGKDIYDNFKSARLVFEEASDILHMDFKKLAFEGPEDELNRTAITQPVLFTVSAAILEAMKDAGVGIDNPPSFLAGHSLGEYTALYYGGAFTFKSGLSLVGKRGEIMEGAVDEGQGAMAAILGMETDDVDKLVEDMSIDSEVVVSANYNGPGQVVISGHRKAVERATEVAVERGAKRAIMLKVSVPSHSPLMKGASEKLTEELSGIEVGDTELPVISNVTALPYPNGEEVKSLLSEQLISPVRWEGCVKYMVDNRANNFVEIGPGKVLSGLVKRINRKVAITSVGDLKSLKAAE
jgi:[acyl-carrier-protein] S-malonyltransferase